MPIPREGKSQEQVFSELDLAATRDLDWRAGGTFAYTYHGGDDVERVAKHAYMRFLTENPLDPTAFPSLAKFETDIVEMARAHLSGGDEVVGSFTSGGTESCMLAVKTARDFARATRPLISEPELILPATAHAAFHKACHYFRVRPVLVPVDMQSFAADPADIRAAVTPQTIQIIASAPSYAHGVMDPIPAIAAIAEEHKLLFHVDACIGGFQLPFWKKLGRPVPAFDFAVPGVTSMSMDFHKYGYCPKGASILLYRSQELRRHQIFVGANWTGYALINTTFQSSKSGGPLAATWAVLNYLGEEGYLRLVRRTLEATDIILSGLKSMPDIRLLGDPVMSLIAFTSERVSPFAVIEEMRKERWYLQPQLAFMGSPANIHLTIRQENLEGARAMIAALRAAIGRVKERPLNIPAEIANAARALRAESFALEDLRALMRRVDPHAGSAVANELLNLMNPAARERALGDFANQLHAPRSETAMTQGSG